MNMTRVANLFERMRYSFWALPALGILGATLAALALPPLDRSVHLPDALSFSGTADTARTTLQIIATMCVSVAGISFSVIVVALVLASQQLSPRVMQSFQRHPLNQGALAVFLGTAAFALFLLGSIDDSPKEPVPELGVTLAMLLAAASLALFVAFLHHMVRSLNASTVIRRIAAEGHEAVDDPYPRGLGRAPDDARAAERRVREATAEHEEREVEAPRAGYLASVEAVPVMRAATELGGFVEQRRALGEFVVTGSTVAIVWAPPEALDELAERTRDAFVINEERIVDNDVAFPLRQLADIALKGLSPGINDPTTAENAMDSVTDTLVRFARQEDANLLRVDEGGAPRFRAASPDFDALVRLGFDQVRRDGARRASFAVRLLELLAELRENGGEVALSSRELRRQAALTYEHASAVAEVEGDRVFLEEAYARLHRDVAASAAPARA